MVQNTKVLAVSALSHAFVFEAVHYYLGDEDFPDRDRNKVISGVLEEFESIEDDGM